MNIGDLAFVTYEAGDYKVKDVLVVLTAITAGWCKHKAPTKAQGNPSPAATSPWSLPENHYKPYSPEVGDKVVIVKQMLSWFPNGGLPDTLGMFGTVFLHPGEILKIQFEKQIGNSDTYYYGPNSVVPASLSDEHVETIISELSKGQPQPPTPKKITKYRCINVIAEA